MRRRHAGALLPLVLLLAAAPAWAAGDLMEGRALADALRQGGLVLFFRHGATDWSTQDRDRSDLRDCSTQRVLSTEGRDDARRIGEAARALGVPIGPVLASPYCRTRDTATLAFGRVEATPNLQAAGSHATDADRAKHYAWVRARLAQPVPAGQNVVLVSHGFVAQAVLDVLLGEGEAAVVRPGGAQGYAVVARVKPDDWAGLVAAAGK